MNIKFNLIKKSEWVASGTKPKRRRTLRNQLKRERLTFGMKTDRSLIKESVQASSMSS
jgi:hypothetical protein